MPDVDGPPEPPHRDLGAELQALNDQLRALSTREADRLQQVLDDGAQLSDDERRGLRDEITRFRQIAATELD